MSSMTPESEFGGCPWPVDTGCLDDDWDSLPEDLKQRSIMLASSSLRALTAYRVGECPITVRPCTARDCTPATAFGSGSWISPGLVNGAWVNGCGCTSACSCSSACEIKLPGPVGRVDEIKVDGIPIDLSNIRIDNGNIIVWQGGGSCPFNLAQDLSLPDTAPGTFSITYLNAYPVSAEGALAVGMLAMEFSKACRKKKCGLPRGVTDVVRNGLSFTIEAGLFPNGLTSIEVVDAFILQWNPQGRTRKSTVWSPDVPRPRVSRSATGVPLPPGGGILDGGGP